MATIVAVRSGNWSDTSHVTGPWPGASTPTTKPGVDDTVQSGAFIVTIDEDVHVVGLQKTGNGGFYVEAVDGDALEIIAQVQNLFEAPDGGSGTALQINEEIEDKFIDIIGDVSAGAGLAATGIGSYGSALRSITGNIGGGSNSGCGVMGSVYSVTGNVVGGGVGSHGINGFVTYIYGDVSAGNGSYGVYSPSGSVTVDGSLICGPNGQPPIYGPFRLVANPANAIVVRTPDGEPWTLSNDYPAPADVRSGVEYDRGTQTGELAAGGSIGPVSIVIGGGGIRIS